MTQRDLHYERIDVALCAAGAFFVGFITALLAVWAALSLHAT